jgi:hypothetical protein
LMKFSDIVAGTAKAARMLKNADIKSY